MEEQRREYKEELLGYVQGKLSLTAQRIMEAPFTIEGLTKATQALAKCKSPSPKGLTAEFFQAY